jgi:hypothetical protein
MNTVKIQLAKLKLLIRSRSHIDDLRTQLIEFDSYG